MPILAGSSSPTVTESATGNGVTITVTSENDSARMAIDLVGGVYEYPVYVLRRDRNGTTLVRSTSAGTVLWSTSTTYPRAGGSVMEDTVPDTSPDGGALVEFYSSGFAAYSDGYVWDGYGFAMSDATVPTIYDYEARQELETDYIVTDLDGTPLVDVRVTVPRWGTWLKAPGSPHLNLSCYWKADSEYQRAGQVSLLQPRGAKFPIALSERRSGPVGSFQLLTMTDEDARSMSSLLNGGQPLMVDVPDSYGVPVRYISVDNVTGTRAARDISDEARVWTLQIVEIAAPVGLPAGQDFTYTGLAALADSYIALGATFATYDDMALGLES